MATIPGIVSPTIVGVLTPNETQEEWRLVFYIAAGIYMFGMIVFALFASGEKQPWADDDGETSYMSEMMKDEEQEREGLLNATETDAEN